MNLSEELLKFNITDDHIDNMIEPLNLNNLRIIVRNRNYVDYMNIKRYVRYFIKYNVFQMWYSSQDRDQFFYHYHLNYSNDDDFFNMLENSSIKIHVDIYDRTFLIKQICHLNPDEYSLNDRLIFGMISSGIGMDIDWAFYDGDRFMSWMCIKSNMYIIRYIIEQYPEKFNNQACNMIYNTIRYRNNYEELLDYLLSFNIEIVIDLTDVLLLYIVGTNNIELLKKLIYYENFKFKNDEDRIQLIRHMIAISKHNSESLCFLIDKYDLGNEIWKSFDIILTKDNIQIFKHITNNYSVRKLNCNIFKKMNSECYRCYLVCCCIKKTHMKFIIDMLENYVELNVDHITDIVRVNFDLYNYLLENGIDLFDHKMHTIIIKSAIYFKDRQLIDVVNNRFNYSSDDKEPFLKLIKEMNLLL